MGSAENRGRGSVSGNFVTNSFLVRGTPSVLIIVRLESNFCALRIDDSRGVQESRKNLGLGLDFETNGSLGLSLDLEI